MKRMHRILSSFSRGSKNARLNQLMFRNVKTVETNANGTSGCSSEIWKEFRKDFGTYKESVKKYLNSSRVWDTWQQNAPN